MVSTRRKLFPWLLLLPGFIGLGITLPYSWYLLLSYALTHSAFFLAPPGAWNGFANFVTAFQDPVFLRSLEGLALFSGSLVILDNVIGLGAATVLNKPFRGVSIVVAAILLPWIIATVASSVMWRLFLDTRQGIVNALLVDAFHLLPANGRIQFFTDPNIAWMSLIGIGVWKGYPLLAVVYLAAMKGVPTELNEAATIEGASGLQKFRSVTLPFISPVVILMSLFLVIWTSSGIEFVYTLTGGGPGTATMILPVLAYFNMFKADNIGVAAAEMIILLVIDAFFLVLILRRVKWGG